MPTYFPFVYNATTACGVCAHISMETLVTQQHVSNESSGQVWCGNLTPRKVWTLIQPSRKIDR